MTTTGSPCLTVGDVRREIEGLSDETPVCLAWWYNQARVHIEMTQVALRADNDSPTREALVFEQNTV